MNDPKYLILTIHRISSLPLSSFLYSMLLPNLVDRPSCSQIYRVKPSSISYCLKYYLHYSPRVSSHPFMLFLSADYETTIASSSDRLYWRFQRSLTHCPTPLDCMDLTYVAGIIIQWCVLDSSHSHTICPGPFSRLYQQRGLNRQITSSMLYVHYSLPRSSPFGWDHEPLPLTDGSYQPVSSILHWSLLLWCGNTNASDCHPYGEPDILPSKLHQAG